MSSASRLIRRARRESHLSQTQLAQTSGIKQSSISLYETGRRDPTTDTLDRLLSSTGSQLVAIKTRRPTVAAVAEQISADVAEGRFDNAYRSFLVANDTLRAETALNRILLSAEEPASTGDARLDAALAGIVVYYLSPDGQPLPEWVDQSSRFVIEPWYVDDSVYGREYDPAQTPKALLERNVVLSEEGLTNA